MAYGFSFNEPLTRWVSSVETDASTEIFDIGVSAADDIGDIWFAEGYLDQGQDYFTEILERPYFKESSPTERLKIQKALFGSAAWLYEPELRTDGLWSENVSTSSLVFDTTSRLVVSGALGDALTELDPTLLEAAGHFAESRLDRLVLIGGAATHAALSYAYTMLIEGDSYSAADQHRSLQWVTTVGGDLNGDFRMTRYARPIDRVTTTLDLNTRHHFAPVVYDAHILAYHSVEPDIVSGLLLHLVKEAGYAGSDIRDNIYRLLDSKNVLAAGNYADYGDEDIHYIAQKLEYKLSDYRQGSNKVLCESIVDPGFETGKFYLQSRDGGVEFLTASRGEVVSKAFIPDSEIEQYIATLVLANGGRTSPGALRKLIDLIGEYSDATGG